MTMMMIVMCYLVPHLPGMYMNCIAHTLYYFNDPMGILLLIIFSVELPLPISRSNLVYVLNPLRQACLQIICHTMAVWWPSMHQIVPVFPRSPPLSYRYDPCRTSGRRKFRKQN